MAVYVAGTHHEGLRNFTAVICGTGRQAETAANEICLLAGLDCLLPAENLEV
jgi:hypothetical protein